eukprot:Gb_06478 [translate_table: standard]
MWCFLNSKALTWDNLQKRNRVSPSRCPLCKVSEETNNHLVVECSFSKQVWREIALLTRLRNVWLGGIVEEGLRAWCGNPRVKSLLALPVIITWGIWLGRNNRLFEDKEILPFQCAAQGLSIINYFPQLKKEKPPR